MPLEKWSALGTYTTGIAGAGVAPTLKNLASGGQKLGSEIDLTGANDRNIIADFDLQVRFASAPTAGGYVELYAIQDVKGDGSYQDGDDTVVPPLTARIGTFPIRAVSTQQRVALRGVIVPATKWKPLIINSASTAFTNTDNENVLSYRVYTPELV